MRTAPRCEKHEATERIKVRYVNALKFGICIAGRAMRLAQAPLATR